MASKFTPGRKEPIKPAPQKLRPDMGRTPPERPPRPKTTLPSIYTKVKELPSKGLAYQKDAEISYRTYNFGEIKKASGSQDLPFLEQLDFVLEGIDCNFDKNDLTLADGLWLALLRYLWTLGSGKFSAPFTCPGCQHYNNAIVEVKDIAFDDIRVESLPVFAELNCGDFEVMPLTIGQWRKLCQLGLEDEPLAAIAMQCVNIPFDAALEKVKTLIGLDMEVMSEVDRLMYHGIQPVTAHCTNANCKQIVKIEIEGRQSLLLPFRESDAPIKDRIHFGKRADNRSIRAR